MSEHLDEALDTVLERIAAVARRTFGAASCSIALLDEAAGELVYRAADGEAAERVVGLRLPVARGLAGFAASAGQALIVDNVVADPRFAADVAERVGYVPQRMLVTPIARGDETLGVLSIVDPPTEAPPGAGLELAGVLADAAAAAVELAGVADPAAVAGLGPLAGPLVDLRALGEDERDTAAALLRELVAYTRRRNRR